MPKKIITLPSTTAAPKGYPLRISEGGYEGEHHYFTVARFLKRFGSEDYGYGSGPDMLRRMGYCGEFTFDEQTQGYWGELEILDGNLAARQLDKWEEKHHPIDVGLY